MKLALFT